MFLLMASNELVVDSDFLAKYRAAFFNMSFSSLSCSFSRLGVPLNEKEL